MTVPKCLVSSDSIPIRNWPLFQAAGSWQDKLIQTGVIYAMKKSLFFPMFVIVLLSACAGQSAREAPYHDPVNSARIRLFGKNYARNTFIIAFFQVWTHWKSNSLMA
jgi:hypothetical protein